MIEVSPALSATIWIAGDCHTAETVCRAFCLAFYREHNHNLCVTLSQTQFIYTSSLEAGVSIRLVSYPTRFDLLTTAKALANKLMDSMVQRSALIEMADEMHWLSA